MNLLFVTKQTHVEVSGDDPSSYVGVWKSAGGFVRQELRPDGTYLKQKGSRRTVTGRYAIEDRRIAYESDDGRAFAGEFTEGRLHQAGMIFYKATEPRARAPRHAPRRGPSRPGVELGAAGGSD